MELWRLLTQDKSSDDTFAAFRLKVERTLLLDRLFAGRETRAAVTDVVPDAADSIDWFRKDTAEEQLALMRSERLGIDGVGIHEDFFDLGEHSLIATRMLPRTREQFTAQPALHDVFDGPTTHRLVERIEVATPEVAGVTGITGDREEMLF
jgi:hypothetical protein